MKGRYLISRASNNSKSRASTRFGTVTMDSKLMYSATTATTEPKTVDFERVQQEYLQALASHAREHQNRIEQLRQKIHISAVSIQRRWRKYISNKKAVSTALIQRWWKKVMKRLKYRQLVIERVRKTILSIRLRDALTTYVRKRLNKMPSKSISTRIQSLASLFGNCRCVKPLLGIISKKITLEANIQNEIRYMIGLKEYNKNNFNKQWQTYEAQLTKFIKAQTDKKWVNEKYTYFDQTKGKLVTKSVWFDEKGKERDREAFIQKEVEKLYEVKFQKYETAQQEVQKGISNLEKVRNYYHQQYLKTVYLRYKEQRSKFRSVSI